MINHLLTCLAGTLFLLPLANNTKFATAIAPTEICDNALDDDGDGLIDINDPDCECDARKPSSLIPNPSFEDHSCCPNAPGVLGCADTWIQASEPTTDYLHPCGWFGWDYMSVPLPIPDGEACVGFRNGKYRTEVDPQWKEYVGACLLAPLQAGKSYRIRFHVGYSDALYSPPTNIAFFGTTNCDNLPFGIGNESFGCPSNDPNWQQLGQVAISGTNEWQVKEINITPTQDIYAIAIGPDCTPIDSEFDMFYYFDNLVLAEEAAFELSVTTAGIPCSPDFTLIIPPAADIIGYQWYKDGIALIGETNPYLTVTTGNGVYQARVTNAEGCAITPPFVLDAPAIYTDVDAEICRGSSYNFNGQILTEEGTYFDTLKTATNCDSIIQLNLAWVDRIFSETSARICQGDTYNFNGQLLTAVGTYLDTISTAQGCDSIVRLSLEWRENVFGEANASICQGDTYNFNGQIVTEEGTYWDTIRTAQSCDSIVRLNLTWRDNVFGEASASICQGDSYNFNGHVLTEPGTYWDTIRTSQSCDSIVRLNLELMNGGSDTMVVKIFEGERYQMGQHRFDKEGEYDVFFSSEAGCDSVLHLILEFYHIYIPSAFSPNSDGNNDAFTLFGGDDLVMVKDLQIYDRWGNFVFRNNNFVPNDLSLGWNGSINGKPAPIGVYVYTALLVMHDGKEKRFSKEVVLVR
ncbi:MAG: gliding motility-associated C-terminal domain-containing protein [Saprospiraceae bacterium]|nr:gliding motility-associated C-terminal domain-containing protein [Saprospiraceae bacterium]